MADLEHGFLLSATGELIEPDDGIVAIGSGGNYALAAARAPRQQAELSAARSCSGRWRSRRHLRLHQSATSRARAGPGDREGRRPEERSGHVSRNRPAHRLRPQPRPNHRRPKPASPRPALARGPDARGRSWRSSTSYIVGQDDAKKAGGHRAAQPLARASAPDEIRDEITPNNIILIGPTGVGKTEIARRLARLAGAPFIKVEASKFTEVGYVGRDVESMVRDLVERAIDMVRTEREDEVSRTAEERVEERLLDLLLPPPTAARRPGRPTPSGAAGAPGRVRGRLHRRRRSRTPPPPAEAPAHRRARSSASCCSTGQLDDREVEIEVTQQSFPMME